MKPAKLLILVPPVLALAIMGGWILRQRNELRRERQAETTDSSGRHRPEKAEKTGTLKVVDPMKAGWKPFALQMWRLTTAGDPASLKAFLAHRDRIKQLSVGEISTAVDEIEGESFGDDEAKTRLLDELRRELLDREPRVLLEYARNGIADGRFKQCHYLKEALGKFAASSPREAIAWMNDVIEKGAFDYAGASRYNPMWLEFEKTLIFGMLSTAPALAEERVAGLPAETRHQVLTEQLLIMNPQPQLQAAFYQICRNFLDPEEVRQRVVTLASVAVTSGGINAVSNLLTTLGATPDERAAVCNATASDYMRFVSRSKDPDLEDVETLRTWVTSQGVGDSERATGDALGYLAGRPKFGVERAFENVRRYHERSHSDRLLAEFLGWPAVWKDPARCTELAGLIRNQNLRKESMTPP